MVKVHVFKLSVSGEYCLFKFLLACNFVPRYDYELSFVGVHCRHPWTQKDANCFTYS
jgi:hypothetical protein